MTIPDILNTARTIINEVGPGDIAESSLQSAGDLVDVALDQLECEAERDEEEGIRLGFLS